MKKQTLLLLLALFCLAQSLKVGPFEVQVADGTLTSVYPSTNEKFLNLSGLQLKHITSRAFDKTVQITSLDLSNNQINSLSDNVFSKLTNLVQLSIVNNSRHLNITRQFLRLKKLKLLDLTDSKFNYGKDSFAGLPDDCELRQERIITHLEPKLFGIKEFLQIGKQNLAKFNCSHRQPIPLTKLMSQEVNRDIKLIGSVKSNLNVTFCYNNERVELVVLVPIPGCGSISSPPEILSLSNRGIRYFKSNWCRLANSYNLLELIIENNELTEIDENLLNELPRSIVTVSLRRNKLKELKGKIMKNNKLQKLDLAFNRIDRVDKDAFRKTTSLVDLSLQNNIISDLNFVSGLPITLVRLHLGNNNITILPNNTFVHLKNLYILDLSGNKIKSLNERTFFGLDRLSDLHLDNNEFEIIEKGPFDNLTCVQVLSFSGNEIFAIDKGFAKNMNNMKALRIDDKVEVSHFERGLLYGLPADSVVYTSIHLESIEPGVFRKY